MGQWGIPQRCASSLALSADR